MKSICCSNCLYSNTAIEPDTYPNCDGGTNGSTPNSGSLADDLAQAAAQSIDMISDTFAVYTSASVPRTTNELSEVDHVVDQAITAISDTFYKGVNIALPFSNDGVNSSP